MPRLSTDVPWDKIPIGRFYKKQRAVAQSSLKLLNELCLDDHLITQSHIAKIDCAKKRADRIGNGQGQILKYGLNPLPLDLRDVATLLTYRS